MIDKKIFLKGINSDDADHLLDPQEYLGAMNMRFATSEGGKFGILSNIEGNTKKMDTINPLGATVTFSLPAGTNTTIGAYEDGPFKRIFWFNNNSNGEDGVYCYDYTDDKVYTVLLSSSVDGGLNFSNDITGVAMIDNLLYWTDNDNPQRRINVEAAIRLNHPTMFPDTDAYVGYTAYYNTAAKINQSVINLIRNQPWVPLTVSKELDNTYSNNLISGEVFQFAYRFVYRDYEVSTFSPLSNLINYNYQESPLNYNAIDVTIPLNQKIEQDVVRIEVAVKYVTGGKQFIVKMFENKSDFDLHNTATIYNNPLKFRFYNDVIGVTVDDVSAVKPFDSVPIKSGALEIAKDRLFLGNNLNGYESPKTTSLALSSTEISNTLKGYWSQIQYKKNTTYYRKYVLELWGIGTSSGFYEYFPAPTPPNFPATVNFFDLHYMGNTISQVLEYLGVSSGQYESYNPGLGSSVVLGYTGTFPGVAGSTVFKSDSTYRFGVVFYDYAGRKCGVVTNNALTFVTKDRDYSTSAFTNTINWALASNSSEIPEWAYYYSVVMTKCLRTNFFMQLRTDDIKYVIKNTDGTYDVTQTSYASTRHGIAIKISSLYGYKMGYQYQEGDIVKLYPSTNAIPYKLKIKDQYGDFIICDLVDLGSLSSTIINYLYEIYTPYAQNFNEFYYEKGAAYAITNPGAANRNYSTLSGSFSGDVTVLNRNQYWVEAMSPNDLYWKSWNTNIGRTNIVTTGEVRQDGVNIVFSNIIIVGTQTNGFSTFDALNNSWVPIELTTIQMLKLVAKIEAEGTVMLAIGEQETTSIYLGETQVFDNTGSSFLARSSGVIGNMNTLRGSFGTINPESVVSFLGQLYWFDAYKGCVVRYDTNGLFPISSNKMFKYFKKVGQDVLKHGLKVFGGVDPYHLEVLMFVPRMSLEYGGTLLEDQILLSAGYNNDGYYYVLDGYNNIVEDGNDNLVVYQDGSGSASNHYDIPVVAGRIYRVVGSGVTVNYAGQTWVSGQYFVATDEYSTISIDLAIGGSFTLYELIRPVYDPYDAQGGVWVYKTELDRWSSFYSYRPEWFGMVGNRLASFKNGYLYIHDSTTYNNFYGITRDSSIAFVHNDASNITKVYNSVSIEGDTPSRVHVRTEVPYVQSADAVAGTYDPKTLLNGDFKVKEGVSYAEVYRDRFSPNVTGDYDRKGMTGDKIRGALGKFQVIFLQPNTKKNIKFVNVGYILSRGNTTQNLK